MFLSLSVPPNTRMENQLLLSCARTSIEPERAEIIRDALRNGVNWDELIVKSLRQGVAPLVFRNLIRVAEKMVPQEVLERLNEFCRINTARLFLLTAELHNLLRQFANNGFQAVPFKGPVLAASAYGDLTLRQYGDLDILIRTEDFEQVKTFLLAHNYFPWRSMTGAEEAKHLRTKHAYTFIRADGLVKVDLHWRIAQQEYSFGLEPDSLRLRLGSVSLGGKDVPNLSNEDCLMVLCIHGAKHCWERLGWICDVAELIRVNPGLNWDEILAKSHALYASRAVLVGLDLAESLLEAPLPRDVLLAIRGDRRARWVSHVLKKRLFARSGKMQLLEEAFIFCMMRERLKNKLPHLAYSFRRALTPNEIDKNLVTLPNYLNFLYYPLRGLRLANKTIMRVCRRTL